MLLQLCSNCKFHLVIQDHKRSDLCLSKRDNVSRCIDLHQVLYISVKMSIYVSRFTYTYQDPLASTVEPRLSGFLDYPDSFSGPNLVMNIY